ncbi:MAG: potassium transporter [Muribaculaceae bacterium]|nr:potassium transporter [Muribaculaceae bacterium]
MGDRTKDETRNPRLPQRPGTQWTRMLERIRQAHARLTLHFMPAIRLGASLLDIITFVASVVCLTALTIRAGFYHTPAGMTAIWRAVRICQLIFLAGIIYNLALNTRATRRTARPIKWLADGAVLLTLLPLLYPHPAHPWIPALERILYSHLFLYAIMAAYSAICFSFGIVAVIGKRTNPSLILSASFLLFILIGSLVLMMPKFTTGGISFADALFVSTSAVCITGLSTVDVSATFTPAGLLVLALLIQTGALGVMTFTSFFALFFSGRTSIHSQLLVKDMIYSKTFSGLLPTLLYILAFTLAVEAAGAAAIFLCIHGTLHFPLRDEIIFSAFHSLSAFCNAGFSSIEGGLSNPLLLHSNQSVYVVTALLVLAGGIGFPTLVNVRQGARSHLGRLWHRMRHRMSPCRRPEHIYDLNSKTVIWATLWVTLASTVMFLVMEYDNALAGMPFGHKLAQAFFNAFVPRSSGFSSVNPAGFMNVTLLMFVVLMWIGGASQSTAGGIKINTFAVMALNLKAVVLGRDRVTAFRRTVSVPSLRRAHAVVGISIVALTAFSMALVALEPQLPLKATLYEAASALFTVGSSLGITAELSTPSKILLTAAMFLGRVGIISLLVGIVGTHTDPPARFPADDIIIN